MRILVDIDGIITNTLPTWLQRIYETTGVKARLSDVTKWNLYENSPLSQVPIPDLLAPLNERGFTANLPMMADADIFLKKLYDAGHDISIVTARHGVVCIPETIEWFEAMMPWLDVHKKLWFVHEKHRLTADVIIDDKAEYLIDYKNAHPNAHLITIDYPFNKHAPTSTHRVLNNGHEWEAIESHIRKLNELSNN
jgi:5'(3')-deoxyribonucleotidase